MWRFGRYSERKKRKLPFTTTPLPFEAPSPANPCEYTQKPYFTIGPKLRSLCYHSAADLMGLSLFEFLWWTPKDVCNATERIAVQGQFRVIQGRWFGYQSKAPMRFSISDDSNLGPILHRFGDTAVYWSKNRQNRQFVPTPVSEIALARVDPYWMSW